MKLNYKKTIFVGFAFFLIAALLTSREVPMVRRRV